MDIIVESLLESSLKLGDWPPETSWMERAVYSLPVRLRPRNAAFDFLRENILNTRLPSAQMICGQWVACVVAQHLGTSDPKSQLKGGLNP